MMELSKTAATETDFDVQPNLDVKRRKRAHSSFASTKLPSNAMKGSTTEASNEYMDCGEKSVLPASARSRLQHLQDHGIMPHVLSFLDETGLFQLENTHSEMIGSIPIARQWCHLFLRDENKTVSSHKRWRPIDETDMKAFGENVSARVPLKANVDVEENKSGDITTNGYRYRKEQIAPYLGRNFAREALFVREREKEACLIYKFDHIPKDESNIAIFKDHHSLTGTTQASSQVSSEGKVHWCEWYDFIANNVNEKFAFVRLSLRDGSGRFWHGFRRLKTNYNTTFFCMHFDMKELIKDMRWKELESWASRQHRLKATEHLMRMTQLTVSLDGKLLVATGGYSPSSTSSSANGKYYFHARHYHLPLADNTKNDLQWLPYRVSLADDLAQNKLVIQFECDHANLPFMRAQDIGNPNACAHW